MILVKIELHSARTGKVTEIGRMTITNNGLGTEKRSDYDIKIMRRGSANKVQRCGMVRNYPRQSYTVWELVRRALVAGLGKWPIHPGEAAAAILARPKAKDRKALKAVKR